MRAVSRLKIEEEVRAHFMFHSIQLGPHQISTVWRMVHEVAESLCMARPDVFISGDGASNAFAFGVQRQTVVLTRGIVDMMTDRELRAIVTHELAHGLCQHLLYRNVGLALAGGTARQLVKLFPSGLVNETIGRLLSAWYRAAEYSADRAALLVLDDPEPLASCLGRLAGMPQRFAAEFDLRLFAEQVKAYDAEATLWSRLMTFDLGALATHPEPARRAVAILEWARSEDYRRIRSGEYLTRVEGESFDQVQIDGVTSCPRCRRPVGELAVCPNPECSLPQEPERQRLCPRGHLNAASWKFCRSCGQAVSGEATGSGTPGP